MQKWFVKDLSKLTGVSVQTLHHYDRIGLLKPSMRAPNGYRLYSEGDLLRLQQIIALKFFGFELSQIKQLLAGKIGLKEHFDMQVKALEQKASKLMDASNTLKSIVSDLGDNESIPIENIINLIEVYNMAKNLEHPWVKDIFTQEELKQYAAFEAELKTKFSEKELEQRWGSIMSDLNTNLKSDPKSAIGIDIGGRWMSLINEMYGRKYAHLRTKKFEQGFGEGRGLEDVGLTLESMRWMEKAIETYWTDRFRKILDKVGTGAPDDEIFHLWNQALLDLDGDDNSRKKRVYDMALADDKVSEKAKEWLKILRELTKVNKHLV